MMAAWLAVVLAVSAGGLTQAPDAERVEAAVKKSSERRYRLIEDGVDHGTLVLKATLREEPDRRAVVFEGSMELGREGRRMTVAVKETAELSGLRLRAAARTMTGAGEWVLSVSGGKGLLTMRDGEDVRESEMAVTDRTVGEIGIMWLVSAAEQKEKVAFKVDRLRLFERTLDRDVTLTCLGREAVEIGGRSIEAWKWEQRAGTGKPDHYWVSAEGALLRYMERGEREFVLDPR